MISAVYKCRELPGESPHFHWFVVPSYKFVLQNVAGCHKPGTELISELFCYSSGSGQVVRVPGYKHTCRKLHPCCVGKNTELVGLVCQVLRFQPAAIQAKAVTTAASVPVVERK
jgi:hypothetical protein